ncbi:hypothetical protein KLP40_14640 [Hymenobacter sp. NST-14]|uniref:hypothetical protein n=1 Tax=Hymenobacter piscis TaxID=2839984 RepID=UPI001C019959|nr:hypothetical protein [Hymenobacter piscis]MBT9394406.1 hypothetical protein [Hymenobacter piscis]
MSKQPVLNKAALADLMQQPVSPAVRWWLIPYYELNAQQAWSRRAQFVLEEPGQPLRTWPLHPNTFVGLLGRLRQQEAFPIPHLPGHEYDNFARLDELLQQAAQLWHTRSGVVEQVLEGIYRLDDTDGIPLQHAVAWQRRAEALLKRLQWSELFTCWQRSGPPHFEQHSEQLAEAVARAEAVLPELEAFSREPVPQVVPGWSGAVTNGDGSGYRERTRYYFEREYQGSSFAYAKVNTYDAVWRRHEQEAEEAYWQEQTKAPRTLARSQRASVREQLLSIRRQIDDVLQQLQEEADLTDEE